MKLCRFNEDRVGLVSGDLVVDVTHLLPVRMNEGKRLIGDPLVQALPLLTALAMEDGLEARRIEDVRLASPVAAPGKILAAPVNYSAHVREMLESGLAQGHQLDIAKAGLFLKATSSLVGAGDGIVLSFPERRTDHEVELVVVIGEGGRNIPESEALAAIAGYTLGLDITLRGTEDRSFRKSIDTYTVLGPWLVTAEEVGDPADLDLRLRVNGELRQDARTGDLLWSVARLVSFASSYATLLPGDLIFTGTPQGVGQIHPGDVLRAEGSWIGAMDVTVR